MDAFFIGHGAVILVSDKTAPVSLFLRSWKSDIMREVPTAILMVTGHWDTDAPTLKYPAPGAPDLAKRVKDLLNDSGLGPVKHDDTRSLDHGAWVPLKLIQAYRSVNCRYRQKKVQSTITSWERHLQYHSIREDGVLVIGSGTIAHDLQALGPDDVPVPKWTSDFDSWKESLLNGGYDDVNNNEKAPYAKMNYPSPDHLFPLHVALGAAGHGLRAELIHPSWSNSAISYASYRFTAAK